jgi:hypothetical protein
MTASSLIQHANVCGIDRDKKNPIIINSWSTLSRNKAKTSKDVSKVAEKLFIYYN